MKWTQELSFWAWRIGKAEGDRAGGWVGGRSFDLKGACPPPPTPGKMCILERGKSLGFQSGIQACAILEGIGLGL